MLQAPLGSKHGAPFSETLRFPHPSARGPQLSALKRQQVDTLSHTQPVYLSEVIPSKMTAMAISSPCFVVRERERQTGKRDRQEAKRKTCYTFDVVNAVQRFRVYVRMPTHFDKILRQHHTHVSFCSRDQRRPILSCRSDVERGSSALYLLRRRLK
ncbi:hypothetical protein DPX16_14566 [Anabarilius grahami]|uniref:Uncharacterized protein n=1 Tax=Anabarilius grahami TaxID=495550 RepID=A0A3N0YXK6_ANAGA|nr:hypothetical protein DPX16_14566 [Anabarilius grahami]